MNLREVREYYARATRLMTFMSLMFTLVISGLGVYIADMADLADEKDGRTYALYTVFLVGTVLCLFMVIGCIIGRKDNYEGTFRYRRTVGVLTFVIGCISLISSALITKETYTQWDVYTTAIFMIDMVSGAFVIAFNIVIFILSKRGLSYYDGKKNAKTVPDDMTIEKNDMKYKMQLGICYSIISSAVFLLSVYFSYEINEYSKQYVSNCDTYANIYELVGKAGLTVSLIILILSIVPVIVKNGKLFIGTNMALAVNSVIQFFFTIYSVICICTKDFIKAQYPDVTYIIFAIILTLFSVLLALTAVKKTIGN